MLTLTSGIPPPNFVIVSQSFIQPLEQYTPSKAPPPLPLSLPFVRNQYPDKLLDEQVVEDVESLVAKVIKPVDEVLRSGRIVVELACPIIWKKIGFE